MNRPQQKLVSELVRFPHDRGGIFYIESGSESLLNWQHYNGRTFQTHFVIPALTGMPQLFSYPDNRIEGYGLNGYNYKPDSFEEVKSEARRQGYIRIYVIDSELQIKAVHL